MVARMLSEKTIKVKTGKFPQEWNKILDDFNNSNHTLMAKYLCEEFKINPWWAQIITNRYEWERGSRNN
jgi:hypothetical protein